MSAAKTKLTIVAGEPAAGMEDQPMAALQSGSAPLRMNESVARAMKYWQETIAFGQGNLAAMVTSSKIMTDGLRALTQQVAETGKSNLEQSAAFTQSLMGVKSVKEALDLQKHFMHSALETGAAQARDLQEATLLVAKQAAQPLSERIKSSTGALKE